MTAFTVLAPAKINLGLAILGKRLDGFHDICSIFQTVDLCDELDVSDSGTGLFCDRPGLSTGQDNLVLRAERAFREATGFMHPVRFDLRKRIPMGAGLGGGSADAAAALRGMCRMPDAPEVSRGTLCEIAATLGSDVPFLLSPGMAVVEGRGERVTRVDLPFDFTYVLVYPGFGIPTGWAYGQIRAYSPPDSSYLEAVRHLRVGTLDRETFLAALSNDFEAAVFPDHPVLGQIKRDLVAKGAAAAFLTGSGSTMVGVFDTEAAARECKERFDGRGFEVFVAKGMM